VCQQTCQNHRRRCHTRFGKTVWPRSLRRWLEVTFREGVGSNPKTVISCAVADVESRSLDWQFHSSRASQSRSPFGPRQLPMLSIAAPLSLHSRGESRWCSDVTSTRRAWRLASFRFLLPGVRCSGVYYIQPEVKLPEFGARQEI
jgi:hypothetical protein